MATSLQINTTDANLNTSNQGAITELEELATQIGEFIHYWGFKRVHGRIWTHLFVSKKPLDAADLVRKMKISKALVSISIRELLEYEVVLDAGRSERGTQLYRTNPDILQVILNVLKHREKRILARVQTAHVNLSNTPLEAQIEQGLSQENLGLLQLLIQNASSSLENVIGLRAVDFGVWQKLFNLGPALSASEQAQNQATKQIRTTTALEPISTDNVETSTTSDGVLPINNQPHLSIGTQNFK